MHPDRAAQEGLAMDINGNDTLGNIVDRKPMLEVAPFSMRRRLPRGALIDAPPYGSSISRLEEICLQYQTPSYRWLWPSREYVHDMRADNPPKVW